MFVHCRPVAVWIKNDFSCNRHPLGIDASGCPFLCCSDLGGAPGSCTFCLSANDPTCRKVNLAAIFTLPACIDRNLDCRCMILPIMPAHSDILLEIPLWIITLLPFSHQERKRRHQPPVLCSYLGWQSFVIFSYGYPEVPF